MTRHARSTAATQGKLKPLPCATHQACRQVGLQILHHHHHWCTQLQQHCIAVWSISPHSCMY